LAGIRFSSDVNFVSLHRERLDEILPKAHKIPGNIKLVIDIRNSRGQSNSYRLIDIDHVREISPCIWVFNRFIGSRLPKEWSVFLEQTIKRTAAWSSIKPNGNLF
jgi:hypothetical protein